MALNDFALRIFSAISAMAEVGPVVPHRKKTASMAANPVLPIAIRWLIVRTPEKGVLRFQTFDGAAGRASAASTVINCATSQVVTSVESGVRLGQLHRQRAQNRQAISASCAVLDVIHGLGRRVAGSRAISAICCCDRQPIYLSSLSAPHGSTRAAKRSSARPSKAYSPERETFKSSAVRAASRPWRKNE